ncbi:hypothetical protein [Candidatus Pristimantibacillus sp. PTI5]
MESIVSESLTKTESVAALNEVKASAQALALMAQELQETAMKITVN